VPIHFKVAAAGAAHPLRDKVKKIEKMVKNAFFPNFL
jgi:hypothetical protein